jgi:hypothetical protein
MRTVLHVKGVVAEDFRFWTGWGGARNRRIGSDATITA